MRHSESRRMRRARRKRRILIMKMILIVVVLTAAIVGCIWYFGGPKVEKELTREAGSSLPTVSDFLKKEADNVKLISGLDESVNMNTVADYEVVIEINDKRYTSVLHVKDTVKPVVTTKEATIFTTETVEPEDLIESIEDVTATTVVFAEIPDFTKLGTQEVKLKVTDEGGNVTEAVARVEVVEDTEPPVIEGVTDLTVPAGSSVSYKRNITVTDNYDTDVSLDVDTSAVDLNTVGEYPITYIAIDKAGNKTEVSAVLHVEAASVDNATDSLVNAAADKILTEIVADDMSQYDKAQAIYNWVHEQVAYYDGTPKTDWIQGAYRGLVERKGDCFVYAMTAKVLLTQAGITNMDIEKIPAKTRHYWNLIDLGDGWYHFDTTRRKDGTTFFYKTDAELMAYSTTHDDSHNYDPSQYPTIQ